MHESSESADRAVADADLHDWVLDAALCADDLVEAIVQQADAMRGSVEDIQAADAERERCLRAFGECLAALKSRGDWREHVAEQAAEDLARALRDVRAATDLLERTALAERAAHETLIGHARRVLEVGGEMKVYARTGIARRTPDGAITLRLDGRH